MADIVVFHQDAAENRRLRLTFRNAGYRVKGIYHCNGAVRWLQNAGQKALLVLPAELLHPLRAYLNNVPVLLLSSGQRTSVAGLKGTVAVEASDEELLTMAKELLSNSACMCTLGNLCLNTVTGEVLVGGKPLQLTTTESALLQVLMETPDEPVSRDALLNRAWGYSCAGVTRTVDVHVQRLRKKMGKSWIETVYRSGYKLVMG